MNSKIDEARRLRMIIEANAELLTDDAALEMPHAFPQWDPEGIYDVNDRVRYEDTLYKCVQTHVAQDDWNPDDSPSLWAEVLPGQNGEVGEWTQPTATSPYMKGDRVMHAGQTWESVVDNNVWEPGLYGWELVI